MRRRGPADGRGSPGSGRGVESAHTDTKHTNTQTHRHTNKRPLCRGGTRCARGRPAHPAALGQPRELSGPGGRRFCWGQLERGRAAPISERAGVTLGGEAAPVRPVAGRVSAGRAPSLNAPSPGRGSAAGAAAGRGRVAQPGPPTSRARRTHLPLRSRPWRLSDLEKKERAKISASLAFQCSVCSP